MSERQVGLELRDVEHVTLCYDKGRYCGYPRQAGIYAFDGGAELVVGHNHAPSAYREREDVKHWSYPTLVALARS